MSKIRCKKCNNVIESKYTHDFKRCKCGAVFIDGGNDYLRFGWPSGDPDDYVEIIEGTDNGPRTRELKLRKTNGG